MIKPAKRKITKTQGWYTFADGTKAWYNGLSASEKKIEEYLHGKIVKFEQTKI